MSCEMKMTKTARTSHKHPFLLRVGKWGEIVLPADLCDQLDLDEGDKLILTAEKDGSLKLVPARDVAERAKGLFAGFAPTSLTDELLAERHEEATRE